MEAEAEAEAPLHGVWCYVPGGSPSGLRLFISLRSLFSEEVRSLSFFQCLVWCVPVQLFSERRVACQDGRLNND